MCYEMPRFAPREILNVNPWRTWTARDNTEHDVASQRIVMAGQRSPIRSAGRH